MKKNMLISLVVFGVVMVGNASVVEYNEITPDNIDSFHFHGDLSDYPISAVIAVPHDDKSGTILMGRYEGNEEISQIVQPTAVMNELLDTILTMQELGRGRETADPLLLNPAGHRSDEERRRSGDLRGAVKDPVRNVWLAPFVMAPINTRVVRRSNALMGFPAVTIGAGYRLIWQIVGHHIGLPLPLGNFVLAGSMA